MAINQKKYVDMSSGLGGKSAASSRELIARVISENYLIPTQSVLEFESLDSVSSYFGEKTGEYKFAEKYFTFVSKAITKPKKISYAKYVKEAVGPRIISTISANSIGLFNVITNGNITITVGGSSLVLTAIDLSSVTSLSEVATIIQTKVNADLNPMYKDAKIVFENGSFVFVGGEKINSSISFSTSETGNLAGAMGWDVASSPILSYGAEAETPSECLKRTSDISNNFGSFMFLDTELTIDEIKSVSKWNEAQNVMYVYSISCTSSTFVDYQLAVNGITGVCITLSNGKSEYAEYMPMTIGASVDYSRANSTVNFMYTEFPSEKPTVYTDADSAKYDALNINYLGATQQSGKLLSFYQRGNMQGEINDIGVYFNEIWLKDSIVTACFNLLLALGKIPANQIGANTFAGSFVPIFGLALRNGTIIAGKVLTDTQKAYIDTQLNRKDAWRDVQNNGYVYDATVENRLVNNVSEYYLKYMLIYSKGDAIKKVEGTNILI